MDAGVCLLKWSITHDPFQVHEPCIDGSSDVISQSMDFSFMRFVV